MTVTNWTKYYEFLQEVVAGSVNAILTNATWLPAISYSSKDLKGRFARRRGWTLWLTNLRQTTPLFHWSQQDNLSTIDALTPAGMKCPTLRNFPRMAWHVGAIPRLNSGR